MTTPEQAWLDQYRTLLEVKREFREFLNKREQALFPVAAKLVNGEFHADALRPCSSCEVVTAGTVTHGRMYFEWACRDVYGRCDADTCGWWVRLEDLEQGLALAGIPGS